MKFEIDRQKYIDSGLINEKEHDTFPLLIYNYTQECQFSKAWDDVTMMCRGLIVNKDTREIVARPFKKFFNYEEHVTTGGMIPASIPHVYPKFDGSLGILYWWDGLPYIATRGSFNSDQAKWATNFICKNDIGRWVEKLDKTKTHLFEIIYPENRIVVSYGDREELVHLATIDTETGKTLELDSDFPMASRYDFTSFEELKGRNLANEEGWVLHYPDTDFRMKIKFEEYVRLHKIVTGLSQIGLWEMLRDGKNILDIIVDIPDEMHEWVKKVVLGLCEKFVEIERIATQAELEAKNLATRKEQAEVITKSRYPSVAFAMLDGKDYKQIIWKMIRPHGTLNFRKDIDA